MSRPKIKRRYAESPTERFLNEKDRDYPARVRDVVDEIDPRRVQQRLQKAQDMAEYNGEE
jgi:hypothetical protein